MKDMGLTPTEKGAAKNEINTAGNTARSMGVQMAGSNLSNAISATTNEQTLGALDKLALTDAQIHRENLKTYYEMSNQMQKQKNIIQEDKIAQRNRLEELYGKELQSGQSNVTNSLTSLAMLAPMLKA
jgi:hypothetical protein